MLKQFKKLAINRIGVAGLLSGKMNVNNMIMDSFDDIDERNRTFGMLT